MELEIQSQSKAWGDISMHLLMKRRDVAKCYAYIYQLRFARLSCQTQGRYFCISVIVALRIQYTLT